MEKTGWHIAEGGQDVGSKKGGVYFQVKTELPGKTSKEAEEGNGTGGCGIESAVDEAYFPDTKVAETEETTVDNLHGEKAEGSGVTADAESTSIETTAGSFELHKGFGGVKKRTVLGGPERSQVGEGSKTAVVIMAIGVNVADAGNFGPPKRLAKKGEKCVEGDFALAAKKSIDVGVSEKEGLVVAEGFRATQKDDGGGEEGFGPCQDFEEGFASEEPEGSSNKVRVVTSDVGGNVGGIGVYGRLKSHPFHGRIGSLSVDSREGKGSMGVRGIEVEPKNFHGREGLSGVIGREAWKAAIFLPFLSIRIRRLYLIR